MIPAPVIKLQTQIILITYLLNKKQAVILPKLVSDQDQNQVKIQLVESPKRRTDNHRLKKRSISLVIQLTSVTKAALLKWRNFQNNS